MDENCTAQMYTQYESWFDKPEKAAFSPAVVQGYEDGDGAGLSQNELLIDVPCDTASLSVICVLPLNFFLPSIGHWASDQHQQQKRTDFVQRPEATRY